MDINDFKLPVPGQRLRKAARKAAEIRSVEREDGWSYAYHKGGILIWKPNGTQLHISVAATPADDRGTKLCGFIIDKHREYFGDKFVIRGGTFVCGDVRIYDLDDKQLFIEGWAARQGILDADS